MRDIIFILIMILLIGYILSGKQIKEWIDNNKIEDNKRFYQVFSKPYTDGDCYLLPYDEWGTATYTC